MPSLWRIAEFWHERGIFDVAINEPSCFACQLTAPSDIAAEMASKTRPKQRWDLASPFLERSHLVDRNDGGLDGVQNIVPLCWRCNRKRMPAFRCGTGRWAIAWVSGGGYWLGLPCDLQRFTSSFTAGLLSWPAYVDQCASRTGLSLGEAEECALAVNFRGREISAEF